jgi:hypothetical protein
MISTGRPQGTSAADPCRGTQARCSPRGVLIAVAVRPERLKVMLWATGSASKRIDAASPSNAALPADAACGAGRLAFSPVGSFTSSTSALNEPAGNVLMRTSSISSANQSVRAVLAPIMRVALASAWFRSSLLSPAGLPLKKNRVAPSTRDGHVYALAAGDVARPADQGLAAHQHLVSLAVADERPPVPRAPVLDDDAKPLVGQRPRERLGDEIVAQLGQALALQRLRRAIERHAEGHRETP